MCLISKSTLSAPVWRSLCLDTCIKKIIFHFSNAKFVLIPHRKLTAKNNWHIKYGLIKSVHCNSITDLYCFPNTFINLSTCILLYEQTIQLPLLSNKKDSGNYAQVEGRFELFYKEYISIVCNSSPSYLPHLSLLTILLIITRPFLLIVYVFKSLQPSCNVCGSLHWQVHFEYSKNNKNWTVKFLKKNNTVDPFCF